MSGTDESSDDIVAITPTTKVKVAAGCLILAGVLTSLLALQSSAILQVRGVFGLVTPLFALLGLAGIVTGYRLSRMKSGAAWHGAGAAGLIGLMAIGWFVLTLYNGVVVVLALALVPLASIAALAAVGSSHAVEKAAAARRRLRAEGLDSGL